MIETDEGNSASGETELAITEGPNPVVAAPTDSPKVGGGPASRVGEGEVQFDETRVTTKADTPTVRLRRSSSLFANRGRCCADAREARVVPERV